MTVSFGGWYQRTTLHLTEIYVFLSQGTSHLPLSQDKLHILRIQLNLKQVSRQVGYLEYVEAITNSGITIRYFEDGLYVLQLDSEDIDSAKIRLEDYYSDYFSPAIKYLFSLGAPTPKILANIHSQHPTVVSVSKRPDLTSFGTVYSTITSGKISVTKTPDYIFLQNAPPELIDMQIFFREFKDQLEKYLTIHRTIWEDISAIKDRQNIKGYEVAYYRSLLDSYQKTISLISNRINQMGSYITTRAKCAKELQVDNHLVALFQFKFETLIDTLAYIKEIWSMTRDYIASAIQIIVEIDSKATNRSIQSLQVITTIGVVSGILGYLSSNSLPQITLAGIAFFLLLIGLTLLVETIISTIFKNLKYPVSFTEEAVV